ncbi:MAG: efflux RND transporter periplasmic adaptor subunit [Xanthomonadales bacterium]|nr:efflux RND transporter periplasmic adaptor subunit [Xanthomonadales bacterium]
MTLAACAQDSGPVRPVAEAPDLATLEVRAVAVPRERVWDGVVEAVHQATLSAQTRGRVLELPYDVNDYVEAGAVVVRFTDVEQRSGARQAQAALAAAQAAFTEAEAEHRRIAEVYERRLVARSQLDQAVARRDAERARLDAARAAVREAGEQVDYTVIRAPYPGILTERHVEVGEAVQPGQPLVSGLSLDRLRVQVQVPQSDIAAIRAQGQAWVLLDDGRRVRADRVVVFPYADPGSHSFRVRIELPEADTGLHPGMIAKVAFALGEGERLLLPERVLVRRSEVVAVYVVDEAGVALRQVRVGHRHDELIEILAGLRDGERVAADPGRALAWLAGRREAAR